MLLTTTTTTTAARHAKSPRRTRTPSSTRFVGSAALVGALVLLLSSLGLPAQAHHRGDHPKAGSTTPTRSVTAMDAVGQWAPASTCYDVSLGSECPPLNIWVRGEVVNSNGESLTGFTVTVTVTFHDRTEQHVATVDDFFRHFSVLLTGSTPPLSWTASTDGSDAYYGSQASGMFLPDDSPSLPSGPDLCELSWDC